MKAALESLSNCANAANHRIGALDMTFEVDRRNH